MKLQQINKVTNKVLNTFDSIPEACKILEIPESNIAACASGKRLTAHGYKWKYIIDIERDIKLSLPKIKVNENYWKTLERSIISTMMHLPEENLISIHKKLQTYLDL